MKQYRITTADFNQDSPNDCVLPPNDPVHELKILSGLGGLNGQQRLAEFRAATSVLLVVKKAAYNVNRI